MLAVVVGCKKFHHYIYGAQNVLVVSDDKPLESIFAKDLAHTPARLAKMILQLKRYDIQVKWKPGKQILLPDMLSRAHLKDTRDTEMENLIEVEVHILWNVLPMSGQQYKQL